MLAGPGSLLGSLIEPQTWREHCLLSSGVFQLRGTAVQRAELPSVEP